MLAARPGLAASYQLRSEIGLEYDSNPGRVEIVENDENPPRAVASPGLRGVFGGEAAFQPGDRSRLHLDAQLAGRGFAREAARSDSVGIAQGALSFDHFLAARTSAGLLLSDYEAFQERVAGARDFRSLAPALRLSQRLGSGQLSLGAGYRWFFFKPEPAFDFDGFRGFITHRHLLLGEDDPETGALGAEWDLSATGSVEQRRFDILRCVEGAQACPPDPPQGRRRDLLTSFGLAATRTTDFLVGAGAAVYVNGSNSFGDGLLRLAFHLKGAHLLPLELTFAWRAELLVTSYEQPLALARDPVTGTERASIEDESRSTLRFELVRPIGDSWELGLRYIFYTNEIGTGAVSYRRHSALFSMAYLFDSELAALEAEE